ncbi:hypothetical protein ACIBU0_39230 [Streptomyces sp. NPDC049627]|uniref:hypothetical protein n=1 Tax=Streptomyces sp. NPDC049627 TaxID=3365595 RepID=UPI0037A81B99
MPDTRPDPHGSIQIHPDPLGRTRPARTGRLPPGCGPIPHDSEPAFGPIPHDSEPAFGPIPHDSEPAFGPTPSAPGG